MSVKGALGRRIGACRPDSTGGLCEVRGMGNVEIAGEEKADDCDDVVPGVGGWEEQTETATKLERTRMRGVCANILLSSQSLAPLEAVLDTELRRVRPISLGSFLTDKEAATDPDFDVFLSIGVAPAALRVLPPARSSSKRKGRGRR